MLYGLESLTNKSIFIPRGTEVLKYCDLKHRPLDGDGGEVEDGSDGGQQTGELCGSAHGPWPVPRDHEVLEEVEGGVHQQQQQVCGRQRRQEQRRAGATLSQRDADDERVAPDAAQHGDAVRRHDLEKERILNPRLEHLLRTVHAHDPRRQQIVVGAVRHCHADCKHVLLTSTNLSFL